jgi:hypothetical protein
MLVPIVPVPIWLIGHAFHRQPVPSLARHLAVWRLLPGGRLAWLRRERDGNAQRARAALDS